MMDKIKDFKNLHPEKSVFILASGPSLGLLDLTPLKRRITIGLNRSFLAFPETHYHCTMDARLFPLYPEQFSQTRYLFTIPTCPMGMQLKLLGSEGWSWDLEQGIYSGYTIAYFSLQLAVYMGFSKIFYLGLDLKNQPQHTHFFGHDHHSAQHDTTEYPRMRKMLCYGAEALKGKNVRVYNCSPVSTLDAFEKVDYDWAVKQ